MYLSTLSLSALMNCLQDIKHQIISWLPQIKIKLKLCLQKTLIFSLLAWLQRLSSGQLSFLFLVFFSFFKTVTKRVIITGSWLSGIQNTQLLKMNALHCPTQSSESLHSRTEYSSPHSPQILGLSEGGAYNHRFVFTSKYLQHSFWAMDHLHSSTHHYMLGLFICCF